MSIADGKRNNKHYFECLNRQISTCARLQNSAVWRNPCLPLIVSLHYALAYLKSLPDNIDKWILSMPNIYSDLGHQPIWRYTPLCANSTRIMYNTMCCWVVMSSIFALNFKLLIKSDLLCICCICIHNYNICLMQSTCKLIMSYWYLI